VVSAETLEATLISYPDPNQVADMLIQLALRGGGPDNVTCIVADVIDSPEGATEIPVIVGAAAEARQGARNGLPQFGTPHGVAIQPAGNEIPETPAGRASQLLGSREQAPDEQSVGDEGDAGPDDGGEERPKRRRRWRGPLILLIIVVLLLAGLGGGGYYWSQQQYYVGETSTGYVAIYQGLSEQLAGFHLSKVYQAQQLKVTELPPWEQTQVSGTISASSLGDAQRIVSTLTASAVQCAAWRAGVQASASASASAKARAGTSTPPRPGATTPKTTTTTPKGGATTTRPTTTAPTTSAPTSSSSAQSDLATTCGSTTGSSQ
jgi:protein phosphatase